MSAVEQVLAGFVRAAALLPEQPGLSFRRLSLSARGWVHAGSFRRKPFRDLPPEHRRNGRQDSAELRQEPLPLSPAWSLLCWAGCRMALLAGPEYLESPQMEYVPHPGCEKLYCPVW